MPKPRRELRDLVRRLQPELRSWLVEAWYEDGPRRPRPDSARFRNTARHRSKGLTIGQQLGLPCGWGQR